MLHLFHGELIENSRKELQLLREKFGKGEIVSLDGKRVTPTDLVQATESSSLFGGDRLVIVENLLSRGVSKKSKDFEKWAEHIKQIPKEAEVVFWEEKEQPKTVLAIFPKDTDIALFRPDRRIFTFVESLRPGHTEEVLDHFHAAIQRDAPELVFVMLVRQFRYLLMVKELKKEVKELSPWQLSKFLRQSEYFTLPQLISLYRKLLDIDVTIKLGESPFNLTQCIRLFLVEI